MNLFENLISKARRTLATGKSTVQMLLELKECLQGKGCRTLVTRLLRLYKERGRMFRLLVDSEKKQVEVEVQLKGQNDPLRALVRRYELVQDNSTHFIILHDIETSWPWVNTVLKTFRFHEKRFQIPDQYAELIQLAL